MSYSITFAKHERQADIHQAIEERDGEKLYQFAVLEAEEGNHEYADELVKLVKKWDKEDWSYDEANNN